MTKLSQIVDFSEINAVETAIEQGTYSEDWGATTEEAKTWFIDFAQIKDKADISISWENLVDIANKEDMWEYTLTDDGIYTNEGSE